jgi:hypothetical protein
VPRCAECRFRSSVSLVLTFVSTLAGAVIAPFVPFRLWPGIAVPAAPHASGSGASGYATVIGFVLGFVVAMLGIALHRRLSGLRPLTTYPSVIRLRQEGWHFPVHPSL